jgi:hypothetical protein
VVSFEVVEVEGRKWERMKRREESKCFGKENFE